MVQITCNKVAANDIPALLTFFENIPSDEKCFIKEKNLDLELATAWVNSTRNLHFVAKLDDQRIIGSAAVIPGVGLSSHVGEVRLMIDPAERGKGLGLILARHTLHEVFSQLPLQKLVVEVVAEQTGIIDMFQNLGFVPEALLRDHLCDRQGNLRDIVILSHFVQDNLDEMNTLGIIGELDG